jgi:hypothetical protein
MISRLIKGWKGGNKERWVPRRWSRRMSFKRISSRVERERELPSGRVTRKNKERLLDIFPKCH